MSDFNRNLKKFRLERGLSAKEFAGQIGLKYTTYIAYEDVEAVPPREPRYDVLIEIAKVLKVSVDELLGNTVEEEWLECRKYCRDLEQFGFVVRNDELAEIDLVKVGIIVSGRFEPLATYWGKSCFLRNMKVVFSAEKLWKTFGRVLTKTDLGILLGIDLPDVKVRQEYRQSLLIGDLFFRKQLLQFANIYETHELEQYRTCCRLMDGYAKRGYPKQRLAAKADPDANELVEAMRELTKMEGFDKETADEIISRRMALLHNKLWDGRRLSDEI